MDKRGHERRKKSGADIINEIYGETPDAQLLVVGSVNCLRHGPYVEIGKLMQQQRASILCPSMTDFSTGRYLRQVKEAILEIYLLTGRCYGKNCLRSMASRFASMMPVIWSRMSIK